MLKKIFRKPVSKQAFFIYDPERKSTQTRISNHVKRIKRKIITSICNYPCRCRLERASFASAGFQFGADASNRLDGIRKPEHLALSQPCHRQDLRENQQYTDNQQDRTVECHREDQTRD